MKKLYIVQAQDAEGEMFAYSYHESKESAMEMAAKAKKEHKPNFASPKFKGIVWVEEANLRD